MKPSGIGGMAVMEGVMMKNKDEYAVAVRKPNNEIVVEKSTHKDFSDKVKLFKLPIFRGMMAFVDSMVIGVKVLNYSASFFEDEEETQAKKKKEKKHVKKTKDYDEDFNIEELTAEEMVSDEEELSTTLELVSTDGKKEEKSNALMMVFAVIFSIILSVALFMVLPVFVTNLFSSFIKDKVVIAFIEGIIRLSIFIGYVILASKMPEIKRVFMYHGAEHKTINCLENGFELTVENVRWQSKQHKRCGTSFMLLVILISLIFFMIVPVNDLFWRVISRIVLVPFIAGISYEFIRFAGKSESKIIDILSKPGLLMQGLTTKEPNDDMIEVAIASVGSVFDWRAFLEPEEKVSNQKGKKSKNSGEKHIEAENQASKKKQAIEKKQATEKKQAAEKKQVVKTKQATEAKQVAEAKQIAETKQVVETKQSADNQTEEKKETVKSDTTSSRKNSQASQKPVKKPESAKSNRAEEEDDEILRALDKFFDEKSKDTGK